MKWALLYFNSHPNSFIKSIFLPPREYVWEETPFSNHRRNKYVKCYIGFIKTLIPYKTISDNIPKGFEMLVQTKESVKH